MIDTTRRTLLLPMSMPVTSKRQLKAEVADLMAKAKTADQANIPDGFDTRN